VHQFLLRKTRDFVSTAVHKQNLYLCMVLLNKNGG